MSFYQILSIFLSVVEFFLIIPALWVAGKMLPKIIGWIQPPRLQDQLSHPFARLILWLCLGTLFTYPLLDLLSLLGSWPAFITPGGGGNFATAFGQVPGNSLSALSVVIMVLIYLVIWWVARRTLTAPEELDGVEWSFVILTTASLIYRFISRGVLGFLQLPLPNTVSFLGNLGIGGFILAVVVGLAILAVIVIGINMALANHPLEDERE